MPIYERPTKSLMADWAKEHLVPGRIFNKAAPARWFAEHYPKIKRNTVNMHVEGMSVNNRNRKHHVNIKRGSGHDLFYKLGSDQFRLWVPDSDPPPLYKDDIEKHLLANPLKPRAELNDRIKTIFAGGKTHGLIALTHAANGMKGVANIPMRVEQRIGRIDRLGQEHAKMQEELAGISISTLLKPG